MSKKTTSKVRHQPFIVIEALDAGGSQTQTNLLAKRLKKEGYQVLQLHFPHEDRATGRLVYDKFLLHKNKRPFSRREQALIYIQDFFSRAEDIDRVRSQQKGRHAIVSDRFSTSTLAYQTIGLTGEARQEMLAWINWLVFEDKPRLPRPDIVVFLDTPVEVSLQRLRSKKKDFFETKSKLTAIRNSYLKVASEQGWFTINSMNEQGSERTRQDLHREIWQIVQSALR